MAMAMLGSRALRAVLLSRGLVTACVSKPVNWLNTQTHWGRISKGGVQGALFITNSSGHSYYREAGNIPCPHSWCLPRSGKDNNNSNSWLAGCFPWGWTGWVLPPGLDWLSVPGTGSLWYHVKGEKSYMRGWKATVWGLYQILTAYCVVWIYPFHRCPFYRYEYTHFTENWCRQRWSGFASGEASCQIWAHGF